jgi:hypothetical protein
MGKASLTNTSEPSFQAIFVEKNLLADEESLDYLF